MSYIKEDTSAMLFLGVIVGAAIAAFTTPRRGDEMRKSVAEQAKSLKDTVKEKLQNNNKETAETETEAVKDIFEITPQEPMGEPLKM